MIKTGVAKELSPYNPDWFYIRAASLARKVYLRPRLGVGRLRHIYGTNQNNGYARAHHVKVAGRNIRLALIALEKAGILMRTNDKRNKNILGTVMEGEDSALYNRMVSPEGQRTLNEIAKSVLKTLLERKQ